MDLSFLILDFGCSFLEFEKWNTKFHINSSKESHPTRLNTPLPTSAHC